MTVQMQDRPVCFTCDQRIETNAEIVFEAPCGHLDCSSAVFHPLCLMTWRERRDNFREWLQQLRQQWMERHQYDDDNDREADR